MHCMGSDFCFRSTIFTDPQKLTFQLIQNIILFCFPMQSLDRIRFSVFSMLTRLLYNKYIYQRKIVSTITRCPSSYWMYSEIYNVSCLSVNEYFPKIHIRGWEMSHIPQCNLSWIEKDRWNGVLFDDDKKSHFADFIFYFVYNRVCMYMEEEWKIYPVRVVKTNSAE